MGGFKVRLEGGREDSRIGGEGEKGGWRGGGGGKGVS